jgi:pyruvate dehydrogenase E2 component (dihydrolipoamide acetyltransferase)
MMIPVIMPQVGQDIPRGTIVQWLKRENDVVQKGETIVTVESEKATFEIEAEQSGVLLKILYPKGAEVPILEPVAYIGQVGERFETTAESPPALSEPDAAGMACAPPALSSGAAEIASSARPLASPAVRRLAREKNVDLTTLSGTGPRGRILPEDVLAAVATPQCDRPVPESPAEDTIVPFSKMRKRIAQRLTMSKQTIPHFYAFMDVDMTEAAEWRRSLNDRHGLHVTITDLVIKATAAALRQFPRLNAHVSDQQIVVKSRVNIGVAVSVDDGLLVPVIADADRKRLQEISQGSRQNAEAARRGAQTRSPDGTFTITSLGMYGVKQFVPIINPPEVAILAVGSVEPRVVPVPGGIGARQMMTLTLACDHRAVDGADAVGLLNEIRKKLETPPELSELP